MSSKGNFKKIVEEIQRYAKVPPKPPIGYVPESVPQSTPTGVKRTLPMRNNITSTVPSGSNIDIITMQQSLQDLAQDVSSQLNLQDAFSGDPRKEQEAKARDAFGVFLTKNYMRNSKVQGVEYDPDPKITDVSQKHPDDPTRMSIVMDTMNRVGNPKKGEKFVDGDWGPRTNAAVCDAFAFAYGLLDFVDDVNRFATKKIQTNYYNKTLLEEFSKFANPNYKALSPQQKSQAAPIVTKHVKAIKEMYDEVKKQILQHGAYQQFIEGDVPFKTYQPKVTQPQMDALKKTFPQGIDLNFKNFRTNIKIDDLVSLDTLKAWIQKAAPTANLSPQQVVDQVWQQQQQILGSDSGY